MFLQKLDQRDGRGTQRARLRIHNGERPPQGEARDGKRLDAQCFIVGAQRFCRSFKKGPSGHNRAHQTPVPVVAQLYHV